MEALDLLKYQNVQSKALSGGNKRKLNCAIALLGSPFVILLDEPTTGVDPFAKRLVWRAITQLSTASQNSTVVLTTHSMEEAEALCPRMGIMVDGEFKCFGSAQHIKSRYARSFEVSLRLSQPKLKNLPNFALDKQIGLEL
jgi:ABC-type multidrug transport system ATPase subunit